MIFGVFSLPVAAAMRKTRCYHICLNIIKTIKIQNMAYTNDTQSMAPQFF